MGCSAHSYFQEVSSQEELDKDAKEDEETKASAKNARFEASKQTEDAKF